MRESHAREVLLEGQVHESVLPRAPRDQQAGVLAHGAMLLLDALVLDRHAPARERDEASPQGLVLGSIYGGIASVTEAAGVGVFGALAAALDASRNPSPNKLNPSTARSMAMPGKVITHGALKIRERL